MVWKQIFKGFSVHTYFLVWQRKCRDRSPHEDIGQQSMVVPLYSLLVSPISSSSPQWKTTHVLSPAPSAYSHTTSFKMHYSGMIISCPGSRWGHEQLENCCMLEWNYWRLDSALLSFPLCTFRWKMCTQHAEIRVAAASGVDAPHSLINETEPRKGPGLTPLIKCPFDHYALVTVTSH